MAVGDLYRVALGYRNHGQLNVNVFYLKNSSDGSTESANGVAQKFATFFAPLYQAIKPGGSGTNLYTTEVSKVARLSSDIGSAGAAGPIGVLLGDTLPSVNAVTISMSTGLAGPSRRGRIFVGGVPALWTANSTLNTAGVAGYLTFINALKAGIMGDSPTTGFNLGVFSRSRYAILSNPFDDYWKPVTQLQTRLNIGTMKSRKIGVGQ